MKIVITQEKLKDILNYLQLGSTFPYVSISIKLDKKKEPRIESIQQTPDCTILRIVRFSKENFQSISSKEETFKFDAAITHKLISVEDPKTELTLTKDDEFLKIKTPIREIKINLIEEIDGVLESLPFNMPKGVPTFPNMDNAQIENSISIGLKSFRNIINDSKTLDTEFFHFILNEKQQLSIEVGDLESRSQKVRHTPNAKIKKYVQPVDTIFTTGLKEVANVFGGSVDMRIKTGFPMWLSEEDHKHKIGVMIAPKGEEEES